jgi:hypothetical protein
MTLAPIHLLAAFVAAGCAIAACAAGKARAAGDVAAGRQKALMCQTCHGLDGTAKIPEAPNLAGQSAIYLNERHHVVYSAIVVTFLACAGAVIVQRFDTLAAVTQWADPRAASVPSDEPELPVPAIPDYFGGGATE